MGEHEREDGRAERVRLAAVWPLFGLEVRTPRLTLRYPTDADLLALAALTDDIHEPDALPFVFPWSLLPAGERERGVLRYHWRSRGGVTPEAWELAFAVVVDGEVVGSQAVLATAWPVRRTVETGSWLHRPRQGRGLGTEMRQAVLHLAFAGLGARRAETEAFDWNSSSQVVTERAGYRPNGDQLIAGARPGDPARRVLRYVLDRGDWEPRRRDDVELVGLEPCLPLFEG